MPNSNDTLSVLVNAAPINPTQVSSSDATPCETDTITLNASTVSGVDYSWTGPNGFVSTDEDPIINGVTSLNSGNYILTLTDQVTGCSSLPNSNDTLSVLVNAAPIISLGVLANDNVPCLGDSLYIDAITISGVDYSWTGPNGFVSTDEDVVIGAVSFADAGIYTLVLVDQVTGCLSLDNGNESVEIIVNSVPVINMLDTVLTCNSGTAVLDAGVYDSYLWSTMETTQTISVSSSGTYYVTVYQGSCSSVLDSVYADLSVETISVTSSDGICIGDDFEFSVTGGGTYSWSGPESYSSNDSLNTIYSITENQVGNYNVLVTYPNGCTVTGLVSVLLSDYSVCHKIPEIITPNGDGANDVFVVEFLNQYPNNSLTIFNRWGATTFEASPYLNDFEGIANKGINIGTDKVPNGTYYYVLDLGDGSNVIQGLLEVQQ